jgi:hypothetical protein
MREYSIIKATKYCFKRKDEGGGFQKYSRQGELSQNTLNASVEFSHEIPCSINEYQILKNSLKETGECALRIMLQ